MLGELGRLPCLETRHGAFSTFHRRILRGGYIAWRILRIGTLEGPAGWSFDPSVEGAMTTARRPLTYHLSLSLPPVSLPPVNGLLSSSVLSHTPPL